MFAAVGTDVTLVDRRMRLLRFVDADLRGILHEWMQRSGITVVLGDEVERVEVTSSGDGRYASVSLGSGRTEIVERVLVAAGSDPNTVGLGLELARVEVDPRGFVSANDRFETSVPGIYATGGVVDGLASTTMRIHQARLAMFSAAGLGGDEENPTPMVVYTVPEIATVGLSEEACGLLDIPHVVGRSGLYRSPASAIRGKGEGLMKLVVCSRTHRLLGVHVIGSTAAELVGLGAAFLRRQGRVEEIASTGVSPKSMSEAYHRAALDALSQLGSVVRPRRPAAGPPTSESF
jgi:NAD(P) transhydrogenase